MAVFALKQELNWFLSRKFSDGTLNRSQYEALQNQRTVLNPWYMVETLTTFCTLTEQRLEDLDQYIKPEFNKPINRAFVTLLKAVTELIGCQKLALASDRFLQISEQEGTSDGELMIEFYDTKEVLENIIELEERINILAAP